MDCVLVTHIVMPPGEGHFWSTCYAVWSSLDLITWTGWTFWRGTSFNSDTDTNSALDGFRTTLEDFFSINRGWGGGRCHSSLGWTSLATCQIKVKIQASHSRFPLLWRWFSCTISLSSLLGIYQSSRCLAQPVMRNTQPTEELVQKNLDQRSSRSVPVRLFVWRSFPVGIWMPEPTQFTIHPATGMLTYASIPNISQRIYICIHNWRTIISLLHALTAYTYTEQTRQKWANHNLWVWRDGFLERTR